MRKYVIMGVQGSGKGTQSQLLARDFDLVHISVGDIFRWNVQNHTKLGAQVRRIMAEGNLVGDEMAESVVRDRLTQHDWNYGFIIDGFPRNRRQALFFLESYDIDGVIHLDLPDSEVRRRVLARRLCAGCGMDYNLLANSPHEAGQCDACGGAADHARGRQRAGAGRPAEGLPREDQPGAGPVPAQGVRAHRGRPAGSGQRSSRRSAAVWACPRCRPARRKSRTKPGRSSARDRGLQRERPPRAGP